MPGRRDRLPPFLAPGEGNLNPTGPHLQTGWVPTLRYTTLGGAKHTSSVTEVVEWVQTLAPPDELQSGSSPPPTPVLPLPLVVPPQPPSSPSPHIRRSPRLQALLSSASATTTTSPVYSPAPADLNLDGAGKPLSFSTAIRGPHGREWTLADEQELIKLLVTLKCLLPVMRPAKTPTYLKRVVKEKWDEVNRLRKRRVRWTIGGDRIEIDYDVGTNTAALPTVNALFHSIVSTHSFLATIDIVDITLMLFFPPLSLSELMSPLSLFPPSLNLVSFLTSVTPTENPSSFAMS